jgi:hypothetical protein
MENQDGPRPESPSVFWNKVYAAVVINTVVVVTALWAFSQYFK